MEIIVASSNDHKLKEIRKILPKSCVFHSLKDAGITEEIEEPGNTFAKNAFIKASYIFSLKKTNTLADDSGLEVTALNNEPGVFSARYAGEPSDSLKNIEKLLANLQVTKDRRARFVTVLCFISEAGINYFEGTVQGTITTELRGTNGFGYDPVFIPDGHIRTFAEMAEAEKNRISHRAEALKKFSQFLMALPGNVL